MAEQTGTPPLDLIDGSSLGTDGAKQLRQRTPREDAERLVTSTTRSANPQEQRLVQHGEAWFGPVRHTIAPDLKGPDFNKLVIAAQGGDQGAVSTLFVRLQPAVQRYCRARIGRSGASYQAADDITQEVCLGVLGALKEFADDPSAFLPFVYGIASHKVADHYRKNGRDHADPVADMPNLVDRNVGPEQDAMRGDLRSKLLQLVDQLAPRQREIVLLRLVMGLSAQETASALGLTATAVRVTQHRALNKVRELAMGLDLR